MSKSITKEVFLDRVKERNPFWENIEYLSEFKSLTSPIKFRCKEHNIENEMIARNLTKSICCEECRKNIKPLPLTFHKIGDVIGRLTIVGKGRTKITPSGRRLPTWKCHCECGNDIEIRTDSFGQRNPTQSCGCLQQITMMQNRQHNSIEFRGDIAIWHCENGKTFVTDVNQVDFLSHYCWNNDGKYVITHDSSTTTLRMHVMLMRDNLTSELCCVDHKNGNEFDNRLCNLRVCTQAQNSYNTKRKTNTGWQGVNKVGDKYVVRISKNDEVLFDGSFDTLREAVLKRIELEDKYYGEFSYYKSRGIIWKD